MIIIFFSLCFTSEEEEAIKAQGQIVIILNRTKYGYEICWPRGLDPSP